MKGKYEDCLYNEKTKDGKRLFCHFVDGFYHDKEYCDSCKYFVPAHGKSDKYTSRVVYKEVNCSC